MQDPRHFLLSSFVVIIVRRFLSKLTFKQDFLIIDTAQHEANLGNKFLGNIVIVSESHKLYVVVAHHLPQFKNHLRDLINVKEHGPASDPSHETQLLIVHLRLPQ